LLLPSRILAPAVAQHRVLPFHESGFVAIILQFHAIIWNEDMKGKRLLALSNTNDRLSIEEASAAFVG